MSSTEQEKQLQYEGPPRPKPSVVEDLQRSGTGSEQHQEHTDFFFFTQYSCFKELVSFVRCPNAQCLGDIEVAIDIKKKKGLSQFVSLNCKLCHFTSSSFASKRSTKESAGCPKFLEVNIRAGVAFKEMGKGYEALSSFCTLMNMPSPMSRASFDNCTDEIHNAFSEEVKSSLVNASKETASKCQLNQDGNCSQCTVTVDGTWQTRGYSSLNGLATCIAQ